MKNNGINYTQLSERCGVPVSSLKRQLHNTSLGIDKITSYASSMNTDLIQLSILAKQLQHLDTKTISKVNNQIFTAYPYLYDFIYLLTSLNKTVKEVQEQFQLSDLAITHYLRALEMLGYLEIIEKTHIKLKPHVRFITEEGSPLDILFIEKFRKHQDEHCQRPSVCVARINLSQAQILQVEKNLYDQLVTFHNQNTHNKEANSTNIMLSFVKGDPINLSTEMPELDGDILKALSEIMNGNK